MSRRLRAVLSRLAQALPVILGVVLVLLLLSINIKLPSLPIKK